MKQRVAFSSLRGACGNEKGVALIVVLWIFIFLFVVAFDFSTSVREEAAAAHRFNDETIGYYLAVAGFERGLYDFLNQQGGAAAQQQNQKTDLFDGAWREESVVGGVSRVRLTDEGGKININRVNEETLRRIFTNLGIDPARRDILVDSIMDWRDPDDLHRVNGAESDYYGTLSPAYTAKNGLLDSVEDLLWIRGMTHALFYGYAADEAPAGEEGRRIALRDIFTVDGPIDRVNLRTARAEVIHALTGIPLEKCRNFVEERKKLSEKTLGDLLPLLGVGAGDAALQAFIFTNPSVVAVEAEGRLADSRVPRRVKGIVRLGGAQGFELLRWLDRDFGAPGLAFDSSK
jgi:general secretion pathway protein K